MAGKSSVGGGLFLAAAIAIVALVAGLPLGLGRGIADLWIGVMSVVARLVMSVFG
jgi:hypothetical protein